ncbi:MAG TPA: amidase, partial [bacterium]|nr:amidase [bacterium]
MKAESHLLTLPLRELGGLVRQGECSPVQLAELALDALVRRGGRYQCVVTLTRERALRQAGQAEAELRQGRWRGPLHGIPYGAKDLLATGEGIPTTWGMAPLKEQVFTEDAAALQKLEQAGAVLVAKLAMVEVAGGLRYDQAHASFTGPGINPWNLEAWTGGSSSGSAAAVAAGLVPFAIGSETWGSITSPSAFCGISGLRPTLGRVSRRGCMALSWTLDKLGPLAHGADDCGLVLEALAGPDAQDPACLAE